MKRLRGRASALIAPLFVVVVVVGGAACSPEATRARNGGPGADVGNHSPNSPKPSSPPSLPG